MKKNIMKVALVAAVAAIAGYGVYANQTKEMMSDVMLENVEALASAELSNGRCWASWYKECCVCGNAHFTYAYPIDGYGCEHRVGCSHYE